MQETCPEKEKLKEEKHLKQECVQVTVLRDKGLHVALWYETNAIAYDCETAQ